MMKNKVMLGIVSVLTGLLIFTACRNRVSDSFEESFKIFANLEPVEGASNSTMTVTKGVHSTFLVDIDDIDIEANGLLKPGKHEAWCLEWKKTMRSNNDVHRGVTWYSSIGNGKWRPLNYFFGIKPELEATDPELTYREVQAVIWSLAGHIGIAPEFDVTKLADSELPGDLLTDGRPNFSKKKVQTIVARVLSEYDVPPSLETVLAKSGPISTTSTTDSGCIVGETDSDQQDVCVPVEPVATLVTIEPNPVTVLKGETIELTATVFDAENNIIPEASVTWAIADQSIATITSSGFVTGLEIGETIVEARGDGIGRKAKVTVEANTPNILENTISAGSNFSCGLDNNGNAYCWGYNAYGQLGDGTNYNSGVPVAVAMPTGVSFVNISAGGNHTIALDNNGRAWAWGNNTYDQLGDGTNLHSSTPVAVSMPAGVTFVSISAGVFHTVGLDSDGNAWGWGDNEYGQLGNGTYNPSLPVAVSMPPGVSFATISAGDYHTVALDSSGQGWAWGWNAYGQLGTNTGTSLTPVKVVMPSGVLISIISGGGYHTIALDTDGNAWSWGRNNWGQLGNGTTTASPIPVAVDMPAGTSFSTISAGNGHNIAINNNGNAWGWGWNTSGPVGNNTSTQSNIPVEVSMPSGSGILSVSAGWDHSLAIDSDGNFWAWGGNGYGQLGDGTVINRYTPVEVLVPFP